MPIETCDFTRAEVDRHFELLAALLPFHPLPVADWRTWPNPPRRTASADEFMLMHRKQDGDGYVLGFKHWMTRNYVFILVPDWASTPPALHEVRLYVPSTSEPFMRGDFGPGPSTEAAPSLGV